MLEINTKINASLHKIWNYYISPEHIINWNFASDDWHCPKAENDLFDSKKFKYNMSSKDNKYSFDFEGNYTKVIEFKEINYDIIDGRKVSVSFSEEGKSVFVKIMFDAEKINSEELQIAGWQAILDNFKKYVELN